LLNVNLIVIPWMKANRYKKPNISRRIVRIFCRFLSFLVSLDIFLSLVNISFLWLSHSFYFDVRVCDSDGWLSTIDKNVVILFPFFFYTCLSKKNTSGYGNWIYIYGYLSCEFFLLFIFISLKRISKR
jgi:hypothetical protein